MYRFALRPAWIVSHVLIAALVVVLVNLGFWQLRRHDERAERNAIVEARTEQPAAPVADVLAESDDPAELRYRPVTLTGTYLDDDLLVDNRSSDGLPGAWVVTPLRLSSGEVVAVGRGFISLADSRGDLPAAPAGTVEVTGTLVPWADPCGVRTDEQGQVAGAACLDRDAVEAVAGGEVLPMVVQRVASEPPDPALLPVPLPELDAGPHRSYAAQWFIFATIAVVGYPLVLRRVARDRATVPEHDVASEPELARR